MSKIDESRPFIALNISVLTVSDTRDLASDRSGASLQSMIEESGHTVAERQIVSDDVGEIQTIVKGWIGDPGVDVVITTVAPGLPVVTLRPML